MKTLAFVCGLCISAVGAVGILAPSSLVWLAQHFVTAGAFYVIAMVCLAFGLLLIAVASASRASKTRRDRRVERQALKGNDAGRGSGGSRTHEEPLLSASQKMPISSGSSRARGAERARKAMTDEESGRKIGAGIKRSSERKRHGTVW